MDSIETYREIRTLVVPWFKANGFKRAKASIPAYQKQVDKRTLLIWFRVNRFGWGEAMGSDFVVRCQLSKSEKVDDDSNGCIIADLKCFFTRSEFEEARRIQRSLLEIFKPRCTDRISQELWKLSNEIENETTYEHLNYRFMYYDLEDLKTWSELFLPILPRIENEILKIEPSYGPRKRGAAEQKICRVEFT